MSAIGICMRISLPRNLIGELRGLLDVLRTVAAVIGKVALISNELERNVPLVALDNPGISVHRRIRREIDIQSGRILVVAVVDLLCICRSVATLVIDLEAVARNLARNNITVEIDIAVRDLRLRSTKGIVEVVVLPVLIARTRA